MNFVQSEHEHVMYRRSHDDDILLVGVYVDDLVITRSSLAAVEEFKEEMKRVFLMSDLRLLSFYLGIEVRQVLSWHPFVQVKLFLRFRRRIYVSWNLAF
jgi:hypothetical protein